MSPCSEGKVKGSLHIHAGENVPYQSNMVDAWSCNCLSCLVGNYITYVMFSLVNIDSDLMAAHAPDISAVQCCTLNLQLLFCRYGETSKTANIGFLYA